MHSTSSAARFIIDQLVYDCVVRTSTSTSVASKKSHGLAELRRINAGSVKRGSPKPAASGGIEEVKAGKIEK